MYILCSISVLTKSQVYISIYTYMINHDLFFSEMFTVEDISVVSLRT